MKIPVDFWWIFYATAHVIKNEPKGNILHCTKRTQNKTKIIQWRLLSDWPHPKYKMD